MAPEYESEREALATITDLRLSFKNEYKTTGKKDFTLDEILEFLDKYAEKRKIHK